MKIILGSSSKYRQKILQDAGYTFEVISPDINEKAIRDTDPEKLVLALAKAKAEAVLSKLPKSDGPTFIITADQVVTWQGQIREKPESPEQAKQFLKSYGEAPAQTVSGVVVTNAATGQQAFGVDVATITFKSIPDKVIDQIVADGEIFHHAGGFGVEDRNLKPYITSMDGSFDSIWGLPLNLLKKLLKEIELTENN